MEVRGARSGAIDIGSDFWSSGKNTWLSAVDTRVGPPNVILTYDDGPHPNGTHQILSALAENRATATFFVLLSRTHGHPSIVKEILSQGHEIALHGVDHRSLSGMSPHEVFTRTLDAKDELEDLIGQRIYWFRPPYGHITKKESREVFRAGLTPVLWRVSCRDWEDISNTDRLMRARAVQRPGAIFLAHDNFASLQDLVYNGPAPRFNRGDLTRGLLEVFQGRNFTCCSLRQALKTGLPIWDHENHLP